MNKANVKKVLIDKGEKYLLIAAGALMLLFTIVGITQMSSGINAEQFAQDVEKQANDVAATINGNTAPTDVKKLPPFITDKDPPKIPIVKSSWANNLFFDPIAPPDKRRINPMVLPITEIQADFVHAKIRAYDIQETADGVKRIAVLPPLNKKEQRLDKQGAHDESKALNLRFNNLRTPMVPKQGMPKAKGPAAAPIEMGERQSVEYVPIDDPDKFIGKRHALTLYPQRLVVVQASFPFKAQIEEIQKALRLDDPMKVFDEYKPEEVPLFKGVLVQRQIRDLNGAIESPWSDVDVVNHYLATIYVRKFQDEIDDAGVTLVQLPRLHKLVMPLPKMLEPAKYPALRLPSLVQTIAKQKALKTPPKLGKPPSQFDGGGDVFEPIKASAAGLTGQPIIGAAPEVVRLPPNDDKTELSSEAKFQELPDHVLIRFVDNDIQPGRYYEYRMKVLMQNPNWVGPIAKNKKGPPYKYKIDKVARPSDAEIMLLGADARDEAVIRQRFGMDEDELRRNLATDTVWTESKDKVTVPREEFLFATDPPVDSRGNALVALRKDGGQGLLQIQRWLPIATIEKWKEPIADWVVAEVVATRGTYLGGKSVVNLPVWSSQYNSYQLRDAPAEKGKPRRGVLMDPTRPGPQYVVVDVEGGVRYNRPLTRQSSYTEETAAEILLMDENGVLQVRSSLVDRADTGRADRETAWKAWIERTEKETTSPETSSKVDGFK